jgi:hypothetical protein
MDVDGLTAMASSIQKSFNPAQLDFPSPQSRHDRSGKSIAIDSHSRVGGMDHEL